MISSHSNANQMETFKWYIGATPLDARIVDGVLRCDHVNSEYIRKLYMYDDTSTQLLRYINF